MASTSGLSARVARRSAVRSPSDVVVLVALTVLAARDPRGLARLARRPEIG
jgi:hypothetical protein